jgi:hypothetical protein
MNVGGNRSGSGAFHNALRRECTMKKLAILAGLAAVAMSGSAYAQPAMHQPGGPIKQGKYCWINTSIHGTGWWDVCDTAYSASPRGRSLRGRSDADVAAIDSGSGNGDGGGGGGGGGGR